LANDGLQAIGGIGAALLFLGAGTNGYDAFSAVMSSPWSTEKFTESEYELEQAQRYVMHATTISWVYVGGAAGIAWISGERMAAIAAIVGGLIVTAYMRWLYRQAVSRSPLAAPPQASAAPAAPTRVNGSYTWTP
jgi:hypothetical protein